MIKSFIALSMYKKENRKFLCQFLHAWFLVKFCFTDVPRVLILIVKTWQPYSNLKIIACSLLEESYCLRIPLDLLSLFSIEIIREI